MSRPRSAAVVVGQDLDADADGVSGREKGREGSDDSTVDRMPAWPQTSPRVTAKGAVRWTGQRVTPRDGHRGNAGEGRRSPGCREDLAEATTSGEDERRVGNGNERCRSRRRVRHGSVGHARTSAQHRARSRRGRAPEGHQRRPGRHGARHGRVPRGETPGFAGGGRWRQRCSMPLCAVHHRIDGGDRLGRTSSTSLADANANDRCGRRLHSDRRRSSGDRSSSDATRRTRAVSAVDKGERDFNLLAAAVNLARLAPRCHQPQRADRRDRLRRSPAEKPGPKRHSPCHTATNASRHRARHGADHQRCVAAPTTASRTPGSPERRFTASASCERGVSVRLGPLRIISRTVPSGVHWPRSMAQPSPACGASVASLADD